MECFGFFSVWQDVAYELAEYCLYVKIPRSIRSFYMKGFGIFSKAFSTSGEVSVFEYIYLVDNVY